MSSVSHHDLQKSISAQLQLLHELNYVDLDMPFQGSGSLSNRENRESAEINKDIRILDCIAVALSTGNPGDVTATAFDRRGNLTLVLSKNGNPTGEDRSAVRSLIEAITHPDCKIGYDLFPFLLAHCHANINHRISALHSCFNDIDMPSLLADYTPESNIGEEFPKSTGYRAFHHTAKSSFHEIISGLIDRLVEASSILVRPEDVEESRDNFVLLVGAANVLLHSRFLRTSSSKPVHREDVGRLSRRLRKVCQYMHGMDKLVYVAKQRFPNGIPHQWVELDELEENSTVACCDPWEVIWNTVPIEHYDVPNIIRQFQIDFPTLAHDWKSLLYPRVHAELRVILYLHSAQLTSQTPVGCSKRSCFACMLWMTAYNLRHHSEFVTSGSHGKPYSNWALPDCAGVVGQQAKEALDAYVQTAIQDRLKDRLSWLMRGGKRPSDEHVSSGSEDEEAQLDTIDEILYRTLVRRK